jgi:vancomycin resistance protein YoaR
MVDMAMWAGRDGTLLDRAVAEVRQAMDGVTLQPVLTFDEAGLDGAIRAALAGLERPPVEASITMGAGGPVTKPPVLGRTADPAPALAAALAIVRATDEPIAVPAEHVIAVQVTPVRPTRDDAAVRVALVRAQRLIADVIVVYGKKTWTIGAATIRGWVTFENAADGSIRPVLDASPAAVMLDEARTAVLVPAVDASFLKSRKGKVIGAMAGQDGRQLNVAATIARIEAELENRTAGDLPTPVRVAFAPLPPAFTTEQAAATAPLMEVLGTWTTWFPISERNYFGANIWRPAQIINGTILAPGQRFEWWSGVGPISPARGFGPGGVIRSDHTDPTGALGGGMCSSSTTLFNAAMRAGLRINARSNHKYYINRYPLGLDATVSISRHSVQTMSFTNDTKGPIYIRGIRTRGTGGRGYVTYQIWGVPDGRKVTVGRPVVTNVRGAVTREVVVDTLPHGVRKQTEYPSNAMNVSVTRVVQDAEGRILHRDTFLTRYVLWNGRIEVGR